MPLTSPKALPRHPLSTVLAPTGPLRVSINLGNPVLAGRDPANGVLHGVSVDLARGLAAALGVEAQLIAFDTAGQSVEAVRSEQVDLGFFAIDPLRGEGVRFTPPYVMIEGAYLVPDGSILLRNEAVDQPGHRVVVGRGSAYDLFLSRHLRHAEIVRAPTSPTVVDTFVALGAEVAAGVRQQLQADLQRLPGYRLLPERFMVIYQAMGIPASRESRAHDVVCAYIEEAKQSGQVAQLLARHGIAGAAVAPPGFPPAC